MANKSKKKENATEELTNAVVVETPTEENTKNVDTVKVEDEKTEVKDEVAEVVAPNINEVKTQKEESKKENKPKVENKTNPQANRKLGYGVIRSWNGIEY